MLNKALLLWVFVALLAPIASGLVLDPEIPVSIDPNCLVWFPMEEGQGGVSTNYADGLTVVEVNDLHWDVSTPNQGAYSLYAIDGNSLEFELPSLASVPGLTISGWHRLDTPGDTDRLWQLGGIEAPLITCFPRDPVLGILALHIQIPGSPVMLSHETAFPVGEWTHYALTWSADHQVIVLHVNGIPEFLPGNQQDLGQILPQVSHLEIGPYTGHMDDIRIYDRALDGREVQHAAQAHPSSPCRPFPADGSSVLVDKGIDLEWKAPSAVESFNFYVGANPDQLELKASELTQANFSLPWMSAWNDPNGAYWQVESILADGITRSPLWQFLPASKTASQFVDQVASVSTHRSYRYYGTEVPELVLEDMNGRFHVLSAYEGRQLILVRARPTCSACQWELPHLLKLYRETSRADLQIIIYGNPNREAEIRSMWFYKPDMIIPIALADLSTLPEPFNQIQSIPTAIFIDAGGRFKVMTVGALTETLMENILGGAHTLY